MADNEIVAFDMDGVITNSNLESLYNCKQAVRRLKAEIEKSGLPSPRFMTTAFSDTSANMVSVEVFSLSDF